jgi:hypothetical protein
MLLSHHIKQDGYYEAWTQGIPHEVHRVIYCIFMDFSSI